MRLTSAVALAAATAPIAVSAKGTLGYAIGSRTEGGDCKDYSYYQADFAALKAAGALPEVFRTYATVDGSGRGVGKPDCKNTGDILRAAKEFNVKVVVGLWADSEPEFQANYDEALKAVTDQNIDSVYAFTVGSEGLYRWEQNPDVDPTLRPGYEPDDLLRMINLFKEAIGDRGWNKKVGTADSWGKFSDGTADVLIEEGVDLFLINAFAYWQGNKGGKVVDTYLTDLQKGFEHIQKIAGSRSVELWNGETGWPTDDGSDFVENKAGDEKAQEFYSEAVCAALGWNINVFYFSAFDEPWKPNTKGDRNQDGTEGKEYNEQNWGLFNAQRQQVVKDLSCNYRGKEAALREDL